MQAIPLESLGLHHYSVLKGFMYAQTDGHAPSQARANVAFINGCALQLASVDKLSCPGSQPWLISSLMILVPAWEGELVVSSTTTLTSRVHSVILLAGKVCPSSPPVCGQPSRGPFFGCVVAREAILFPNGISEGSAEGSSIQSMVLRIAEQHTWELA